jgi:predicted RNA-binding protein with RPS1 domain
MHRPVRRRSPRNPYSVDNIIDLWECDLVDVQSLAKYNDIYRYMLTVIDVFSKFLHIVQLRVKTGTAVASAFLSIFKDKKYSTPIHRRPIWFRTDRGKVFLNRQFQDLLQKEGIQFQVCRDTNVKFPVLERSHRNIRDRLFIYFTHKNTFNYIVEVQKFVRAYNDTVHVATCMTPSKVGDSDILSIRKNMRARQRKRKTAWAKFRAGQHVRFNKEKLKFSKDVEQNYTTEFSKYAKWCTEAHVLCMN